MGETNKLTIKDWAEADRPREKLLTKGIQSLSDAELIAILLVSGNRDETAVELARKILVSSNNNINELAKRSLEELMKFKGIGEAKAITISAALELGRRRKMEDVLIKQQITSSVDLFDFFQPLLMDLPYEEFWILLLSRSNKIIEKYKIGQGGISGTVADVRLIMRFAIEKLASSIILCHNHPSGNIQPSNEDFEITKKMIEAAKLFDIKILDHIIIGNDKYYSFVDHEII